MPIKDALLPEFDHEMGTTRRLLDRVPEADFAWKPHDRSMSLGQLSGHLANIPTWCGLVLENTVFDLDSLGPDIRSTQPASRAGAAAGIRREGGGRPRQPGATVGPGAHGPLDARERRPGDLHAAPHQRAPQLRDEPLHPSPRTVERVFAASQRAAPADLRPNRGRRMIDRRSQSSSFNARGAPPPLALARRLRASLGPRALLLLPFLILATANAAGYRYGASDQAFYGPAVMQRLDPALFPRDTPLLNTQAQLTLRRRNGRGDSAGLGHRSPAPLRRAVRPHPGVDRHGALWRSDVLYRERWTAVALLRR